MWLLLPHYHFSPQSLKKVKKLVKILYNKYLEVGESQPLLLYIKIIVFKQKRAATLAASIATTLFVIPVLASDTSLTEALQSVTTFTPEVELVESPEVETTIVTKWVGKGFTETETFVLDFLQERGITDRAALATIMGNIRQESLFQTNICEGGAKTGYHGCHRGGFGLIQWTTVNRYNGLGEFARKYGGDPNSLHTQLRYMVNETQWVKNEHIWKTPNQSIGTYMNAAYRWLGWGIHGARTTYANQYYTALTQIEVEVPAVT